MKETLKTILLWLWKNARGKFLGASVGIAFALSVLILGFWRVLFIILCMVAGIFLGHKLDERKEIFFNWDFDFLKDQANNEDEKNLYNLK